MTNQEMLTIVKMRGWRLRSETNWRIGKRVWYVVNEDKVVEVTPRDTKGQALQWAVALITNDTETQEAMRMMEVYGELYDEVAK